MIISKNKQGSDEWLEERKSVFTSSEFAPFMIQATTDAAKKARSKYLCEKITESLPMDEYEMEAYAKSQSFMDRDPWIRRGKYLEPFARDRLSKMLGKEIIETGLIFYDEKKEFACSPDGLIVSNDGETWEAGIEIKCHNRVRHLADLMADEVPKDHLYQIHGCMAVTRLDQWHYFGYHPSLPSLRKVVYRDEFTEKLINALKDLAIEKRQTQKTLAKIFDNQFSTPNVKCPPTDETEKPLIRD